MKKFLSACLVMCGLAAMADTVVTVEAVEEIAIGGGGESAMTMALGMPTLWWSAPFAAVLALLMAAVFYKKMIAADEGSDRMKEIAGTSAKARWLTFTASTRWWAWCSSCCS